MNKPLQEWANENKPDDKMLWKDAYWNQVMFVRDKVAGLLAHTYDEYKSMVRVVGTHNSKSILCPVYFIELEEGVRIYMRYNYYNWNISVESLHTPITCDFLGCFSDENYGYCYVEGMEDHKYGTYAENNKKFTVCIHDTYDVYVFFRALKRLFKIVPKQD